MACRVAPGRAPPPAKPLPVKSVRPHRCLRAKNRPAGSPAGRRDGQGWQRIIRSVAVGRGRRVVVATTHAAGTAGTALVTAAAGAAGPTPFTTAATLAALAAAHARGVQGFQGFQLVRRQDFLQLRLGFGLERGDLFGLVGSEV